MPFVYINSSPKLQVINLQSGKSLHAQPYTKYLLDSGDEKSVEIVNKKKAKTGVLLSSSVVNGATPVPTDEGHVKLQSIKREKRLSAQEKPKLPRMVLETVIKKN